MPRYHDSHDFTNNSQEILTILVEPGEIVRLRESGRRLDYADYSGEEFGYEVEVPPGASVQTIKFAN